MVTTDATTEALCLQLRAQGRGVLAIHDEATSLTGGFNKYRKGAGTDRQFYESAWSGSPISVSRVRTTQLGRAIEKIEVPHPYLSIIGGTQPDRLCEFVDRKQGHDGFIDRFVLSFPEPSYSAYATAGISQKVTANYGDLIEGLLGLAEKLIVPSRLIGPIVHLSADGLAKWIELAEQHISRKSTLADFQRGACSKLLAYAARFTLGLHLGYFVSGEVTDPAVSPGTVENAFELVRYFSSHSLKVHTHVNRHEQDARIETLFKWLNEHPKTKSIHDVLTAKVAGLRTSADAMEMFRLMQQSRMGMIRSETPKNGGRAKVWFQPGVTK
jgi:hypothetical protein